MEVCGRAAVEKSSQISPKTSVYIGGREGTLPWGSRSPKGVGRVQGGRTPPPQTELDLVWWEGVPLPSHLLLFFLSLLIFFSLAHRALVGCPTSPLRAGVSPQSLWASPGWVAPPGELPEPIRHSRYIPGNSENLPVIK